MVHMAKFHQNRLKDLGARRVDDRQTHTHTDKQTQAIIRAILRIGPKLEILKAAVEKYANSLQRL